MAVGGAQYTKLKGLSETFNLVYLTPSTDQWKAAF